MNPTSSAKTTPAAYPEQWEQAAGENTVTRIHWPEYHITNNKTHRKLEEKQMSYTRPKAQPQGHPYTDANMVREGLIAEIYAINGYAEYIANSDVEEINQVWRRIMQGEKEHFGMFLQTLRRHDPEEYERYQEAKKVILDKKIALPTYSPQYDRQLILNILREAIKEELEAIILYEQKAVDACSTDVASLFRQIAAQEKWHVELQVKVLLKYDPDQYGPIKNPKLPSTVIKPSSAYGQCSSLPAGLSTRPPSYIDNHAPSSGSSPFPDQRSPWPQPRHSLPSWTSGHKPNLC